MLRYLLRQLPARLGHTPRLDIYCGTSVGAVHSCFLAATADAPEESIQKLTAIWRGMSFSTVYQFGLRDALSFSQMLFGSVRGKPLEIVEHPDRIHGLFNTGPLERLVVESIPWRRLRRNLRRGLFSALCVSTTEIATGRTIVFVDTPEREVPSWTRDTGVVARASAIGPTHALASAAIPFLFPAVRIGNTYYCDGGVRMHSPLSPALRLGANRVLIVGMSRQRPEHEHDRLAKERVRHFLSASFLFGKVLDALLMDRIENDLAHMRLLNRILSAGVRAFGPDFLTRVNAIAERERGLGFRIVQDCFIRPSEDIGVIAGRHVERLRRAPSRSWLGGLAFRMITRGSPEEEADLLSYLLFEGEYAEELMALGRSDAERHEEELVRFFSDEAEAGTAATG